MTSSKLAFNYTDGRYTSVEEIIGFMRGHTMRNVTVHPVKEYFEEGDSPWASASHLTRLEMHSVLG